VSTQTFNLECRSRFSENGSQEGYDIYGGNADPRLKNILAHIVEGTGSEHQKLTRLFVNSEKLLSACCSALALIDISTPYARMSTSKELREAIHDATGIWIDPPK
jgi:hypothetical protein